MPYIGTPPASELANLDINGQKLILDADADTSITSDTDDQIDVEISGADDFRFTANTFTALSGSTIAIASGATIANSGTATGFGALAGIDDQSSSNDDQLTITDTAVIINEDSDDVDFRIESNGNANMFIVNGGSNLVGVASDPDLGAGLHIKTADSGGSVHANADELVIEGSAHSGMTILSGASSDGSIFFGDSGSNSDAEIKVDHSERDMIFEIGGGEKLRLENSQGNVIINNGAATTTSNASMSSGLTIQQGGADNESFACKSSDVAHQFTSYTETDTYFSLKKWGVGGSYINSIATANEANGLVFNVIAGDPVATPDTGSLGTIGFYVGCCEDSQGTLEDFASNAVLFSLRRRDASGARTVFHIDEDGDILYDGGASAFDNEDDALLARAFELERAENASPSHKGSGPSQIIKSEFDRFIGNAKEKLTDAGILSRVDPNNATSCDGDGSISEPMVNLTQLQRLHNGAIWQQRVMFETLKEVAEEKLPGFAEKLNERLESRNLPVLPV